MHRHIGKKPSPLRYMRKTHIHNVVRLQAIYSLAIKLYSTRSRLQQTRYGIKQRSLTRAVSSDQGNYLGLTNCQGNIPQGLDLAVKSIYLANFQHNPTLLSIPQ
ncbi:hypothetical protein ES703_86510 [subsurface metagenome]